MRIRHLETEEKRENFLSSLRYNGRSGFFNCHIVKMVSSASIWMIEPSGSVWHVPAGASQNRERVRGIEEKLVKLAAFPHYLEDE